MTTETRWAGAVVLCGLMGAAATAPLPAQTVRGEVVESATGTPVDAGFVLLLSPEGKEVARTLADRQGRFTLRAPAPGDYRLRSERIGFKATTSAPIRLMAAQTIEHRLQVTAVPIRLEEIKVAGETKCRLRPEEGRATATVWDEARKALAAVAWVQAQQRLRVRIRTYERELYTDLRVISEQSRERTGISNRPFRAIPARELAVRGYVQETPDGSFLFQGPDADVLFSDEFLNSHCFRLEQHRDSTTAGMVGLGFDPVGGRDLPDIKGAMWLDEKSAELRYVEFRYTKVNLAAGGDVAGGRVEFQRLSTGGWVVSRFWIRMPMITVVREQKFRSVSDVVRGGGARVESRPELTGIREEGGEVLEVFGRDGTRLAASLGASLAGTIFDSSRSIPLIGAKVQLSGTRQSVVSGPGGQFRLDGLPEGDYAVVFSHPDFPAWGTLPGVPLASLRRAQVTQVSLVVPPTATLVRRWCADADFSTTGVAGGLVTDSLTQQPVREGAVQLIWNRFDVKGGERRGGRPGAVVLNDRTGVEVKTDSTGYFRACGLPADQTIEARVVVGETERRPVTFTVGRGELREVNLRRE